MIALALAEELEEAGFDVLGPALSVAEALGCLERAGNCAAAVVDINLGASSSAPVALALRARGVPFVVMSGYSAAQHPEAFNGAPSLRKPFGIQHLVDALHRLLPPAGA